MLDFEPMSQWRNRDEAARVFRCDGHSASLPKLGIGTGNDEKRGLLSAAHYYVLMQRRVAVSERHSYTITRPEFLKGPRTIGREVYHGRRREACHRQGDVAADSIPDRLPLVFGSAGVLALLLFFSLAEH
jgi:hypothetical protein